MRIFQNTAEAYAEVERELLEMGLTYQSASYQDKDVSDNPDFETRELQGYHFLIDTPDPKEGLATVRANKDEIEAKWVLAEAEERFFQRGQNPGQSHVLRPVWKQFLEEDGRFSYTYSERMADQIPVIIEELKARPNTRQAVVEMHQNAYDLQNLGGKRRIPCSLSYTFHIRDGKMLCYYIMRSSDYYEHFLNDMVLAIMMQDFIRREVDDNLEMGNFHMIVLSLHGFAKDLKARGIF